ncbi:type I secretion system permease/ATPase [Desulforhopalus vacuolatus]|uniref:type I secretion system permease/ATPase n=1 Tax=Desulforhopalus vacuolatus TaxID=40414 RepID=UPI001965596D|nr:type I secretion system permease/ATPase [Desulforhopalus vacuolatus]MBM9521118.1 type I secretion system permease/ATPase [Desulforhopalus vacuolatus]
MKSLLKKWMRYFVFAGIFSLFINTLNLTFPIYMLAIYDKVLVSRSMPTLITVTIGAMFALLVFACLHFLRSRLLVRAGLAIDRTLSEPVVVEMLKDASRVDSLAYKEGIADINMLRNYFAGSAMFSLFDLPWVPVYIFVIYLMHPLLGWLALGGGVILVILGIFQELLTNTRFSTAKAIETQTNQLVAAGLHNAEVLTGMNMLSGFVAHWKRRQDRVVYLQTNAYRFSSLLTSISKSFRSAMQVFVYGLAAYLVLQNETTVGIMIAASIIMRQALNPIEQLMSTWKQTVEARGACRRLGGLLDRRVAPSSMELPEPEGKLDVEAVTLRLANRPILQNISFGLEQGELLGLIGSSGAGKSSLCRVLLGIWAGSSGKVRLDGADIFTRDGQSLGKYIGYLPQDVELFAGTISENIARLGVIDSEKVVQAATFAGVHELILRLPQGYDTQIGEGGRNLSGGQRQRIGLARVFYGEPKLVILDEPNSNLDEQGEKALLQALMQLKNKGVTTIMVTHKPALLSFVDKMLILKDGQVAMFGPREVVFQKLMTPPHGVAASGQNHTT